MTAELARTVVAELRAKVEESRKAAEQQAAAAAEVTGVNARLSGELKDLQGQLAALRTENARLADSESARAEAEIGYRARPLSETLADAFAWHAARTRVHPRGLNRLWLTGAAPVVSRPRSPCE